MRSDERVKRAEVVSDGKSMGNLVLKPAPLVGIFYSRASALTTAGFILIILILVLVHGQATSIDGGLTAETGGRFAALALLLSAVVTAFITRLTFTVPRWVSHLTGLLSFSLLFVLWSLVIMGFDSTAWAVYGGLQVLRARMTFADLDWVAQALDCGGCEEWPQLHGPALEILHSATGTAFGPTWVAPIGLLLAALLSVALVLVSRASGDAGKVLLLIAAVSPAWLLLLDRANLDGAVLLLIVAGVWIAFRFNTLAAWSFFAALVFIAGSIKYYPFVAGLALLPVLLFRRGWIVLVAFAGCFTGYMTIFWSQFRAASAYNSETNAVLWDFPAYGRLIILDRMGASVTGSGEWLLSNGLLIGLSVSALLWGWSLCLFKPRMSLLSPTLAVGGSAVFLAAVAVSGFGYMYKGAFLILIIPLLSLGVAGSQAIGSRFGLFSSLFMLVLIGLALMVAYSSLLASLAAWISASFALGVGLRQMADSVLGSSFSQRTRDLANEH